MNLHLVRSGILKLPVYLGIFVSCDQSVPSSVSSSYSDSEESSRLWTFGLFCVEYSSSICENGKKGWQIRGNHNSVVIIKRFPATYNDFIPFTYVLHALALQHSMALCYFQSTLFSAPFLTCHPTEKR